MTRYLIIVAILAVSVFMTFIGYLVGPYDEELAVAVLFGFMTLLIVGGVTYLVYYSKCVSQLDLPDDELDGKEVVWAKTTQSMIHFKSGNPLKFWEGVGGKLFLTNQVLEFRAHKGQPWVYRLTIPLKQIVRAEPYRLFGIIPGGLRIEREDGSMETFTFGAAFDLSVEWANAIMDFRDDLNLDENTR